MMLPHQHIAVHKQTVVRPWNLIAMLTDKESITSLLRFGDICMINGSRRELQRLTRNNKRIPLLGGTGLEEKTSA